MYDIFSKLLYELDNARDAVLVIVVSNHGSAFRTSGAKMLVSRTGRLWGEFGGASVERHAETLAIDALLARKSLTYSYGQNKTQDIGSLGTGLDGKMTVLFQYISCADSEWLCLCKILKERLSKHLGCQIFYPLDGSAPSLYDGGTLLAGRPWSNMPEPLFVELLPTGT